MKIPEMTTEQIKMLLRKTSPKSLRSIEKDVDYAITTLEKMIRNHVHYKGIMSAACLCERLYGRKYHFFRFVEEYVELHPDLVTEKQYKFFDK